VFPQLLPKQHLCRRLLKPPESSMLGFGAPSSVNSLFGMSWQPGTSRPADRLMDAVLRSALHAKYASCSPAGVHTLTANEYTVGNYYTVNNEGSALRRAPPAMMRSNEPDTRSELGSALAGELRMSAVRSCGRMSDHCRLSTSSCLQASTESWRRRTLTMISCTNRGNRSSQQWSNTSPLQACLSDRQPATPVNLQTCCSKHCAWLTLRLRPRLRHQKPPPSQLTYCLLWALPHHPLMSISISWDPCSLTPRQTFYCQL